MNANSTRSSARAAAAPPGEHDRGLNRLGIQATLHCMTGCLIGEVSGLALGTAFGWGSLATIVAAVALAYVFGFALTSVPLFKAGLALGAIVPIALATDTVSSRSWS